MGKTLVAYFSASGVTKQAAQVLAQAARADLYEICPKERYSRADLNWNDKQSRSSVERKDKTCRPAIKGPDARMEQYDLIFLGFPIWWYTAPKIINTFLEQYDFSGKRIVLFATSGGSGFDHSVADLKPSVTGQAVIEEGKLLNGRYTQESLATWVERFSFGNEAGKKQ